MKLTRLITFTVCAVLSLLIAYVVVAVELILIAVIRYRFFGTKWWLSMVQVVGGGALVFAAALIFGNA